jgi:hypothetical protein
MTLMVSSRKSQKGNIAGSLRVDPEPWVRAASGVAAGGIMGAECRCGWTATRSVVLLRARW